MCFRYKSMISAHDTKLQYMLIFIAKLQKVLVIPNYNNLHKTSKLLQALVIKVKTKNNKMNKNKFNSFKLKLEFQILFQAHLIYLNIFLDA